MKFIKVRYINHKSHLIEHNVPELLVDGDIPNKFKEYLSEMSELKCESICFKFHKDKFFYSIELLKNYDEFLFKIRKISTDSEDDTNQMLDKVASKYLSDDELKDIDSEHKIMLTIYLELKKMKSELETTNNFMLERIKVSEEALSNRMTNFQDKLEDRMKDWQDHIEEKLNKNYLEKEDLNLLSIVSRASKKDLVVGIIFITIILSVIEELDFKRYIRNYLDGPSDAPERLK